MAAAAGKAYDRPMNPIVLEAGLVVLTAVSFWILDRYVIGCEHV
jgi:uncharacterized membrane protein